MGRELNRSTGRRRQRLTASSRSCMGRQTVPIDLPAPPLLPEDQWSGSFVSYWEPMLPGDAITSGTAWFDYKRGVFRIDGLINPWDEASTGVRQWVSETNLATGGRGSPRTPHATRSGR